VPPEFEVRPAAQDWTGDGHRFGILFVCTANLCRSVIAEWTARQCLTRYPAAEASFAVASAGTSANAGTPVPVATADLLTSMGAAPGLPRPGVPVAQGGLELVTSRQLAATDLDQAALVLTAQREHLHESLMLAPGASRRCFLLLEFARLAPAGLAAAGPQTDPVARARDVVAATARARGQGRYVDPDDDEIADPVRSADLYRCAAVIGAAVSASIAALCRAESPVRRGE